MGVDILDFLAAEQKKSARIAANFFRKKSEELEDLGTPMRVMLKELTRYGLRGGKWHRPALVRLAVRLAGGKLTPAINRASLCAELIHRYILIHDDIIDQDLERHAGPTMQKIYQDRFKLLFRGMKDETYSLGMAMIAGDVLNSLNQQLALESGIPKPMAATLVYGLNQELLETGAGWLLETDLKNMPLLKVSLKQVEKAMLLVSAQYSVLWPLRLGQLLSGREYGNWVPEIEIYGMQVGLAFQIQDDILAIFGDQKETGKPVGNDLREGKKTFLTQYAYNKANATDRAYLQNSLGLNIDGERLQNVRDIFRRTGALSYAQNEAQKYARTGLKAIQSLSSTDQDAKDMLVRLGEFLAKRDK